MPQSKPPADKIQLANPESVPKTPALACAAPTKTTRPALKTNLPMKRAACLLSGSSKTKYDTSKDLGVKHQKTHDNDKVNGDARLEIAPKPSKCGHGLEADTPVSDITIPAGQDKPCESSQAACTSVIFVKDE